MAKLTADSQKHFGMGPPWQKSTWGFQGYIPEINWTCGHHHVDTSLAERCAAAEIRRRAAVDSGNESS